MIYNIEEFDSRSDMIEFVRSTVGRTDVRPATSDVKSVLIDSYNLVYWQHDDQELFYIDERMEDRTKVHIVCSCGYSSFFLEYGAWEIFASCANCGKEDSVYSG